jgi:ribosomal protein L22, bacterial type
MKNKNAQTSNGVKATLKNYRQSPRKVRLIADLERGKHPSDALTALQFVDKRAAGPFAKLIRSSMANASQSGKQADNLKITKVTVDITPTIKRFIPRARGAASRINKRNSHITVELG